MSAFDVASAIEGFLKDSDRTSLELPHMTTGQRKSTKKLLEKYSELRCESYGFGTERRLTLFKNLPTESPSNLPTSATSYRCHALEPVAVNIKNTFIDDWAAPEQEPIMFRSLQHCSDKRGLDFASIVRMSREGNVEITSADGSNTARSIGAATFFAGDTALGESPSAMPPSQNTCNGPIIRGESDVLENIPTPTLPDSYEEIQIEERSTFIHFKGHAFADERTVQSMPHGMFKQCILEEASEGGGGYFTPATTSGSDTPTLASEPEQELEEAAPGSAAGVSPDDTCLQLSSGALAIVEGLVKVPEFNGCSAVVQGWDEETRRYDVLLATLGGCQHAKIKKENLRAILPCP
jgi:hypothetical protein